MLEQTTPNYHPQCWCWSFGAGNTPQEQFRAAYGAYCAKFGQLPTVVQVHPGLLVDGLQVPMGLIVQVNGHMPAHAFYIVIGGAS